MEEFKFPDEVEKPNAAAQQTDEIEVEIVDDTPEKDRGRKPLEREVSDPTDDEIESYSDGVQKRIKELTHARHDERRAKEALQREREELERLAQHLVQENNRLKQYVNNGSQQYVSLAQQAAESKLEKARQQLKVAQEAFDTEAIAKAQETLAEAVWEAKEAKNIRPTSLQETQLPVQPVQQIQQAVQPDEKSLRWQAKNQWFGANGFEEVTSYALGLHQKLVNGGVDPRSDEYFEQIDARIKSRFPEIFGGSDERNKPADGSRKPAAVVAPATRSTGTKKVQLTQTQLALAKKYGLTPQQYAAEVAKLEAQNG
jgi:hypothetical protein